MVTDFQRELARVEEDIEGVRGIALLEPVIHEKVTLLAHRLYQRASLTGRLADLRIAEAAISEGLRRAPNGDLWLLKANCDFAMHRIDQSRHELNEYPGLRESVKGKMLAADLDFEAGKYDQAWRGYQHMVLSARAWDTLARLAFFSAKMGEVRKADRLYYEAEEELTAKEMRSYAWVELQRGKLAFEHGRFGSANAHYARAREAYSGFWLVDQHIGDLRRAQGRLRDAAHLYATVVASTRRPEHQQTLGELSSLLGRSAQAEALKRETLVAYVESTARGEVLYYHHLADFYLESNLDSAKALEWAQKDIAIRRNYSTLTVLAWSYFCTGDARKALEISNEAVATRIVDADMLYQAAAINFANGLTTDGKKFLRSAMSVNPEMRKWYQDTLFEEESKTSNY